MIRNKEEYRKNLGLKSLPDMLAAWMDFQDSESSPEGYSQGFGLSTDTRKEAEHCLKAWADTDNNDFVSRLYPIAWANGTGSFYAIWDDASGAAIEQMPIVVFGDEGGAHVVADGLLELMRLTTLDSEISVNHNEVYFYHDEEDLSSDDADAYRDWLQCCFGIEAIDTNEANTLLAAAHARHGEAFDAWLSMTLGG